MHVVDERLDMLAISSRPLASGRRLHREMFLAFSLDFWMTLLYVRHCVWLGMLCLSTASDVETSRHYAISWKGKDW